MELIERMVNRTATFNGLHLPIKTVHSTLIKYADHLVALNDDDTWRFSLLGSAVRIHYRDRYLSICCRHQLKGRDLSRVGLIEDGGEHIITSARSIHFSSANDSDFHDLALFDFTEPCAAGVMDVSRFFPFRSIAPDTASDKHVFVLCTGFPFADQRYELDENHLGSGRRNIICQPQNRSSDPALIKLGIPKGIDFDPDGMSGGSAFVCIERNRKLEIYFAGIITRGGQDGFYIVKAGFVREFLDRALFSR
ncbi:hypothetical protein OIU35_04385 [Boseaceae bacterium BT-24-1]|nr:hypothetical protein [Boseaceae bacterium BT-24-1]